MEKIDYYNTDDEISWIASKVFSDAHYGSALTEDELQLRLEMEEDYKDEFTAKQYFACEAVLNIINYGEHHRW